MDLSLDIPDVAALASSGPFTPVNTETSAFFARLATQPTKGRAMLYDNMITALKAGSVWASFDAFYILSAFDSATARTNLVSSSFGITAVNSPAFTMDRGFTGDGASSYLDTTFNPTTAGGHYAAIAAHISLWNLTSRGLTAFRLGGVVNAGETLIAPHFTGPNTYMRVNDTLAGLADTTSDGYFIASRTALNGAGSHLATQNGVSLTGNTGFSSNTLSNFSMFICAENNAGTPQGFSTDTIGVFSVGGTLNTAQMTALYNAVHTYMRAVAGVA